MWNKTKRHAFVKKRILPENQIKTRELHSEMRSVSSVMWDVACAKTLHIKKNKAVNIMNKNPLLKTKK